MYVNDRIPEERNEIELKHAFEEEDENEEEVMGVSFSLCLSFDEFFLLSCMCVILNLPMCRLNICRSVSKELLGQWNHLKYYTA